jgi:hypothetical protein
MISDHYAQFVASQYKTSDLLGCLFSGDCPPDFRQIVETALWYQGWLPNDLVILVDPPPGDSGLRYRGIP